MNGHTRLGCLSSGIFLSCCFILGNIRHHHRRHHAQQLAKLIKLVPGVQLLMSSS